MKDIIVGVDPGVYTGFAILDLNGNIIAKLVKKDVGEEEAVKIIRNFGKPVVIASDVYPLPHFVSKLAARFNTSVFYPKKSYSLSQKKNINIENPHERDALFAALKCYWHYENRFRSIDSKIKDPILRDKMKENIIKKRRRDS